MANQLGLVFGKLDCTPRWRERLSGLAIPALVVHVVEQGEVELAASSQGSAHFCALVVLQV
jgi:hypothetical protein